MYTHFSCHSSHTQRALLPSKVSDVARGLGRARDVGQKTDTQKKSSWRLTEIILYQHLISFSGSGRKSQETWAPSKECKKTVLFVKQKQKSIKSWLMWWWGLQALKNAEATVNARNEPITSAWGGGASAGGQGRSRERAAGARRRGWRFLPKGPRGTGRAEAELRAGVEWELKARERTPGVMGRYLQEEKSKPAPAVPEVNREDSHLVNMPGVGVFRFVGVQKLSTYVPFLRKETAQITVTNLKLSLLTQPRTERL